jgi:glycerophosphoryl diester phosphodiesterase
MLVISRRGFLTTLNGLAVAPLLLPIHADADGDRIHLIAHRGGIVDDAHPENSPSSVEAAIERGYWMIEVDIRRTSDGRAVVQHDANFQRFYGDPRAVADMTWAEVQKLRATPGGSAPMSFDDLCARCAGRIRLMLDIKTNDAPDDFYQDLIASLRRHRLLDTTFSLSGGRLPELAGGVVAEAADRAALAAAVARGEKVSTRRYLFELASVFDADALNLAKQHQVTAVAAINTFRYARHGDGAAKAAEADARRLLALGVRYFQIDSVYEPLFVKR